MASLGLTTNGKERRSFSRKASGAGARDRDPKKEKIGRDQGVRSGGGGGGGGWKKKNPNKTWGGGGFAWVGWVFVVVGKKTWREGGGQHSSDLPVARTDELSLNRKGMSRPISEKKKRVMATAGKQGKGGHVRVPKH